MSVIGIININEIEFYVVCGATHFKTVYGTICVSLKYTEN